MPLCDDHNLIIGPDRWCHLCNEVKPKRLTSAEAKKVKQKAAEWHYIAFLLIAQAVLFTFIYFGW